MLALAVIENWFCGCVVPPENPRALSSVLFEIDDVTNGRITAFDCCSSVSVRAIVLAARAIVGPALAGRVIFLGRLDRAQVLGCMRRARLFAFPSSLETFGLVIAEAMLEGCPVVVGDEGPFPEFIEHNRSGLLVPPGDPAALAGAILDLLASPARAAALAGAGQDSVRRRFAVTQVVDRNLAYYKSCLSGGSEREELRP